MEIAFIDNIRHTIASNLDNHHFSVEHLSRKIGVSKPQLYRRLMASLGCSANRLITSMRIEKAKEILQKEDIEICSVAYRIGYSDPDYFSKVFKKEVGMRPSEYRKKSNKDLIN